MCSGNAVHFHENYDAGGAPWFNFDRAEMLASINRLEQSRKRQDDRHYPIRRVRRRAAATGSKVPGSTEVGMAVAERGV
jgi:hypothetical protein